MRAIIEQYIFKDVPTMAMVILFGLPILVFLLIGYSSLFKKCNEKRWQAFIPFYNTYILGEIANVHWYYSLLANSLLIVEAIEFYEYEIVFFLISLLGRFIINYNIGKIFHKDYTYVIFMTLLPLPMYTILGFSKDKANIKIKLTKNGPIDSKTTLYDNQDILDKQTKENTTSKKIDQREIIEKIPNTKVKKVTQKTKTIKEIIKQKELSIEELNTYDIPIINMSFDKDSIPNSDTKKEELITHQLSDDELLDIILKKKKERKPRPKTSPKNKKKKAVKRLKQRKKNK